MTTTSSHEDLPRLRPITATYRSMVLLVGLEWLLVLGSNGARSTVQAGGGQAISALFGLALVVVAIVIAVKGYQLAALLRRGAPILWTIGMLIPLLNIAVLLLLSSASQAFCRRYGIRVGFLGPNMDDVARLEAAFRAAEAQRAQLAQQAQA